MSKYTVKFQGAKPVAAIRIEKWINDLRSGEYKQGKKALQSSPKHFCCLGVLCKTQSPGHLLAQDGTLIGGQPDTSDGDPQWMTRINDDFNRKTGHSLVELNDGFVWGEVEGEFSNRPGLHLTFDEIADCLQAVYLEGVDFKRTRK